MTELTSVPTRPLNRNYLQNLAGPATFNLITLVLSSLVFSLAKLTVYAADAFVFIIYSIGALAISQIFVIVLLSIFGKFLVHNQLGKLRVWYVAGLILVINVLGTVLFEAILRSWYFEPIPQSLFQRAISLIFITFIYLGLGWAAQFLSGNLKQVSSAKELLFVVFRQKADLTLTIRDARTFAIREVSLEIQSTTGTIENFIELNNLNESATLQIDQLWKTLTEVESRIGKISNRFPGSTKNLKVFAQVRFSMKDVITASTKTNMVLPAVISVVAFLGFSSWLSYFMLALHAFFWAVLLSLASYFVFWIYEKNLVPAFSSKPILIQIMVYEFIVLAYLFFWLLILGYFAGDNSGAYGAALVYAAIPFIFFNSGALLVGLITSSQEHQENLIMQATSLRKEIAELEQIRNDEEQIWKSIFAGVIAISPTTASVMLRDAVLTKDYDQVMLAIPRVTVLWTTVLSKLPDST